MPETVIQEPVGPRRGRRGGEQGTPMPSGRPAPRSWAARYGQLILQDGIATIPRALFHQQRALDLIAQEVWFVSYLLAHKWQADAPAPSLKQMARNSGVDLSWLKRLRQRLVLRGYLEVEERHETHGGQAPNRYDLGRLFARLESLLAQGAVPENAIRGAGGAEGDEPPDTAFTARFGRVIAREGVAAVPQALFTYQGALALSPQQVWFVCYILSYQWASDLPYPSINKMSLRTGYSEAHLHEIKNSLVDKGFLRVVHRYRASDGGQDNNGYDFSGLIDAINGHLAGQQPAEPTVADELPAPRLIRRRGQRRPATADEAVAPLPLRSPAEGGAESLAGEGRVPHSRGGGLTAVPGEGRSLKPGGAGSGAIGPAAGEKGEGGQAFSRRGARAGGPGGARGSQPVGVASLGAGRAAGSGAGGAVPPALIESSQEEREQVGDSNQHPLAQEKVIALHRASAEGADRPARRAREGQEATQLSLFGAVGSAEATPAEPTVVAGAAIGPQPGAAGGEVRSTGEASSYIAGIVLDFSRELGDEAHVAANITQALRLYGASGQGEQAFVGLLYEARRRTRQYQGRQGLGAIDNKMAYFFRVVASLIEG